MELKGKIALIKYFRRITDIGLIEAKEIVDAFEGVSVCGGAPTSTFCDWDIVLFTLFAGKIRKGEWVIRDGKIFKEATVSYRDIVELTYF